MRKLLFITFICSSLCAYAQSEIPEDTIKNRPPVKKEQIPFSPKENKRTGLDESQPQQSLQGEQQEEINLHLPPSDYVEPLPWTDMKKIHFQKNIFEWDFQRFADFLLSPEVPRGTQWDVGYNASVSYRINPYMRLHAFGQYSGYGRSNSFHGYMNPMYPQSGYGMVLELKVTDWLDLNGGMERSYDPTKMKWVTSPVFAPTIRIKK